MSNYKQWLRSNSDNLKLVYSYAIEHNVNIKSVDNVLHILKIVDPDNATVEQAKIYSKMLQLFRTIFRSTLKENFDT